MTKYKQIKKPFTVLLQAFKNYLQKQKYQTNSIRQFTNYTACFLSWIQSNGTDTEQVNYSDMLVYIEYCKDQGDSNSLINRKLAAVRKYYEYLQSQGEDLKSPASGIILKGKRKGIPHNLLSIEELQEIYNKYQVYDLRTARNKVIISLLIHQGISSGELKELKLKHLNLHEGSIEIPRGRQTNPRSLKLEAKQIIELQQYLNKTRPQILKALQKNPYWSGRKVVNPDFDYLKSQLIISMNGSTNIKASLHHLMCALQKINPNIRNAGQIRQSLITEWLKTEDVRKVQYKAGHKHVSTTERYQSNNLEDLQEALNTHHPLN